MVVVEPFFLWRFLVVHLYIHITRDYYVTRGEAERDGKMSKHTSTRQYARESSDNHPILLLLLMMMMSRLFFSFE
jgi:hypothetical protein